MSVLVCSLKFLRINALAKIIFCLVTEILSIMCFLACSGVISLAICPSVAYFWAFFSYFFRSSLPRVYWSPVFRKGKEPMVKQPDRNYSILMAMPISSFLVCILPLNIYGAPSVSWIITALAPKLAAFFCIITVRSMTWMSLPATDIIASCS